MKRTKKENEKKKKIHIYIYIYIHAYIHTFMETDRNNRLVLCVSLRTAPDSFGYSADKYNNYNNNNNSKEI